MSKSVMLRTSNEDIKLNIDNYPLVNDISSLADTPEGWCYVASNNHELNSKFNSGYGLCYTNRNGTAFQIYICDDYDDTFIRRCKSGVTDLNTATWHLQT